MIDRPQRQQLEAYLKNEKAGAAKIQALADWAMLQQATRDLHIAENKDDPPELALWQLESKKTATQCHINLQSFGPNAHIYEETYHNAESILSLYGSSYEHILSDLAQINRRKAKEGV